jgi:hypothetical protein
VAEFPKSSTTFRQVVDYFLDCHRRGGVDFLVCFNRPVVKMVVVREDHISDPRKSAWLGDIEAFSAFQEYSHNRRGATPFEALQLTTQRQQEADFNNLTFPLIGHIRHVILDQKVPSVFGSIVAVNNVEGSFQYRHYAVVLNERPLTLLLPKTFVDRIRPELTELQNYAASCFVTDPKCPIQGVAFHYVQGKLTHFYWGPKGELLSSARIVKEKNIEDFMQTTREEFGMEWFGSLVLRTAPPATYGIASNRWQISVRK